MKSTYNLLKRGGATFMSFIALDSYRRAVIGDNKVKQSDRLLQETSDKYVSAVKEIQDREDIIASDKVEIIASLGRIKETINIMEHDTKILTHEASINNNQTIDNSAKIIDKSAVGIIDEINKLMNKVNTKSTPNNFIDLTNLFSSLTTQQLGAISHILASIAILGCLFDIAVAYYGDFLIIYFKLEEKYP